MFAKTISDGLLVLVLTVSMLVVGSAESRASGPVLGQQPAASEAGSPGGGASSATTAASHATAANTVILHERSGSVQNNRPVSIARPFAQGEISNFVKASIDGVPLLTQTDVKNRWPDGSLKFAVVSFVVPQIPAGGAVEVGFTEQLSGNNTDFLGQGDMLLPQYDFDGVIQMTGNTTEIVSAREMLAAGHFRYWLRGPIVTSVIIEDRDRIFDRDFGDGSRALHPIFEARFYPASNDVQLGYTVENVWSSDNASNSMRDLVYSLRITSGLSVPELELDHAQFNHIGRSRWHVEYWLGDDPARISVDHNVAYLVTTKAIPNFDTSLSIDEAVVASRYALWTSRDQTIDGDAQHLGSYDKALDAAGAADWIGLLNTWDILYLLTMDDRMHEVSLGNANLAGRMPVHYREADDLAGTGEFFDADGQVATRGRVVSINARKTVTLSDLTLSCGTAYADDHFHIGPSTTDGWGTIGSSHMPEVSYLPYLTTGQHYYLEELQYWAAYMVAWKGGCYGGDYTRQGEAGLLNNTNIRADAWGLRTLAYAAFISLDGSPEKEYFEEKLVNNISMWEGVQNLVLGEPANQFEWDWGRNSRTMNPYWQQPGQLPSPLGQWSSGTSAFIQAPLVDDGSLLSATSPWSENFLLNALGMAKQFGFPTNGLLKFMARLRFNLLLNPSANIYLVEAYRYPTQSASTGDWMQSYPEFASFFSPEPTGWRANLNTDHSYNFIALSAVSFLYDQEVDGYSGREAWDTFKAVSPFQERFGTESPKWAILPHGISDLVFVDGFENGSTSVWSATIP